MLQGAKERIARWHATWGKNTTLLSSMSLCGMGPSMVVEGGTNGAVFEGYLRELLVPALKEGDVVVMDNLSVHKSERVRESSRARAHRSSTCRPTRRTSIR